MSKNCTTISVSKRKKTGQEIREDTSLKRLVGSSPLGIAFVCGVAIAHHVTVKVGVLFAMSNLYADATDPGSVIPAKIAAPDFMKDQPNVKVEVISGDHQNKPDIGTQL